MFKSRADDAAKLSLTQTVGSSHRIAGESGTIGAPPTIVNAVLDALRPLGVDHIDMPVTPARVWDAIRRAKPSSNNPKASQI